MGPKGTVSAFKPIPFRLSSTPNVMWTWILASSCFHLFALWKLVRPKSGPVVTSVSRRAIRYTVEDSEYIYLRYGTRKLPRLVRPAPDLIRFKAVFWDDDTGKKHDVTTRIKRHIGPSYEEGLPVPRDMLPISLRHRPGMLQLVLRKRSLFLDPHLGALVGDPAHFRVLGFKFDSMTLQ